MAQPTLHLFVQDNRLAICRLNPQDAIPVWALESSFFSLTRTAHELSVICREENVPPDVKCDRGWCAFKVEGPFAFGETGVLVAVAEPLAEAGISILAIATYDTDYVLVKEAQLVRAISALSQAGHQVRG